MQPWTTEYGTLWALETGNGLPPVCPARVEVEFEEVGDDDIDDLVAAMDLPSSTPIRQRLQGPRRCFCLKVDGKARGAKPGLAHSQRSGGTIATYGWVTHGVEYVGELERKFHLQDNEAYIWDCHTAPAWRGQRFYSALLSHIIYQLHDEGVSRIWIGASRQNRPSIRGFANAGFQPVVDCTYHRFLRLSILWVHQPLSTRHPLIPDAYRILVNEHERRFGQLIVGYQQ